MPKPYNFDNTIVRKFPECDSGFGPRRSDPLTDNPKHGVKANGLLNKLERNDLENNYLKEVDNSYKEFLDFHYEVVTNYDHFHKQVLEANPIPEVQPAEHSLVTFDRLNDLQYIEEDADYTRPTAYAFSSAYRLIIRTRDILAGNLPDAFLMTTEKGGVEFYWKKPNLSLKLTIASSLSGTDYIYVREQGQSLIQEDVSPEALATQLRGYIHKS